MKRLALLFSALLLVLCLSSCAVLDEFIPIVEYKGTPLSTLTFENIDYMGGLTVTYIIDFNENTVVKTVYMPWEEGQQYETEDICEFTEDEERIFINKIYSYGLFDINDRYEPDHTVYDGGGWSLLIEYNDGSVKKSTGSNASPERVFQNCAIPFYDLTGIDILGGVPSSYYSPPRIDFSVDYRYGNYTYSDNSFIDVSCANYLWNGHEKNDVNIYNVAIESEDISLLSWSEYTLVMYTSNYDRRIIGNSGYSPFDECVVMSYNISPELTDGKEVLRTGWFKQVELVLEVNRIYVVTLYFDNGDFVQYAFSTAALDQKIQYGEYNYNIYNEGKSVLMINSDGTFRLNPFDYFEEGDRGVDESLDALVGKWGFEKIGGKEFLVLTVEQTDEIIVFDYSAKGLYLDFDKTTFAIEKYNVDGNSDEMQGRVSFTKR